MTASSIVSDFLLSSDRRVLNFRRSPNTYAGRRPRFSRRNLRRTRSRSSSNRTGLSPPFSPTTHKINKCHHLVPTPPRASARWAAHAPLAAGQFAPSRPAAGCLSAELGPRYGFRGGAGPFDPSYHDDTAPPGLSRHAHPNGTAHLAFQTAPDSELPLAWGTLRILPSAMGTTPLTRWYTYRR